MSFLVWSNSVWETMMVYKSSSESTERLLAAGWWYLKKPDPNQKKSLLQKAQSIPHPLWKRASAFNLPPGSWLLVQFFMPLNLMLHHSIAQVKIAGYFFLLPQYPAPMRLCCILIQISNFLCHINQSHCHLIQSTVMTFMGQPVSMLKYYNINKYNYVQINDLFTCCIYCTSDVCMLVCVKVEVKRGYQVPCPIILPPPYSFGSGARLLLCET